MKEYKEALLNIQTNEVEFIEFEEDELLMHEQIKKEAEEKIAELQANKSATEAAKQAAQDKLKALGLTDLEIAAITGA